MIHYFSVSNYYSIRKKVVLDLRIPKTAPDLPHFRQSQANPDIRLPSVVVQMGPNGSGKTTLLRALVEAIRFAVTPWTSGEKQLQSAFFSFLSEECRGQPTRFCMEFEADWLAPGKTPDLFRYQFSVIRDRHGTTSDRVGSEALFHFPRGRPRRLFERGESNESIYVSSAFEITPTDDRLKAVRKDASILSTLALLNVPLAMRIVEALGKCLSTTNIMYHGNWTPKTTDVINLFEGCSDMKKWVEKEIQSSDLAIQGISIENTPQGNRYVAFKHHGLDQPVPLYFESGGTKHLFHLLPQIHLALMNGIPAILDNVDNNLHVDIVGEIFSWFRSREINPNNAQLLVTSHNVGLLDDLEKEELFIVEKGKDSGTRVHGAQDVRGLRRDTKLYPKYRAGVLGGIPNIG